MTEPAYSPISAFASCPAATGQPGTPRAGCKHYPDGAHRCAGPREHTQPTDQPTERPSYVHACTCGTAWVSATWTKES